MPEGDGVCCQTDSRKRQKKKKVVWFGVGMIALVYTAWSTKVTMTDQRSHAIAIGCHAFVSPQTTDASARYISVTNLSNI